MKKHIIGLLAVVLFYSCTSNKVQVARLQSPNLRTDSTAFYFENDTLLLKYNFHSYMGIVRFTVYNKLNVPLYTDWKKTAFIVGKQKMDYWADDAVFNAQASSYAIYYNYRRYNTSYGSSQSNLQGTITKEERITFIPPGTEIERRSFILMQNRDFKGFKNTAYEEIPASWKPTKTTKIKRLAYTAENSPLSFRNYITYSTREDFAKETYIDNYFWVNEVIEMNSRQHMGKVVEITSDHKYIHAMPYKAPNAFYLNKLPNK